ncbi:MAG: four helix bundle protein [Ignavibacteria bacterium]|nr:four helix bundle protein [Ignavibacteria bacterium]
MGISARAERAGDSRSGIVDFRSQNASSVAMDERGYKKLEVYQLAHRLAVEVHKMSLGLPKHELYEQGSQIRRSSKSVSAQIVEGFSLRKNKNEFLQYLNRAYASATETLEHLL